MHSRWWERGVPMHPNAENAFPEGIFWPNSVHIKTTLKHSYERKKKKKKKKKKTWQIMFGFENRGKTLIFMSRHFDETMTILISHFLRIGALKKKLTGDYFMLKRNKIIYSKRKIWCFIHFSIFFAALSPQHIFPIHLYRVACKCHMDRITYQQVNN